MNTPYKQASISPSHHRRLKRIAKSQGWLMQSAADRAVDCLAEKLDQQAQAKKQNPENTSG